jgi:hypothetical protein
LPEVLMKREPVAAGGPALPDATYLGDGRRGASGQLPGGAALWRAGGRSGALGPPPGSTVSTGTISWSASRQAKCAPRTRPPRPRVRLARSPTPDEVTRRPEWRDGGRSRLNIHRGNPVRLGLLPRSPCLYRNTFGAVHLTQGWPEALALAEAQGARRRARGPHQRARGYCPARRRALRVRVRAAARDRQLAGL